jgi:hypothetical protein
MSEPFRPFETHLDEAAALKLLREATDGAEDGELFLERRRSEALVFDDGRVKNASYDAAEGFGLRAVKGDVAGYAHSTEISEAALRRASETARLAVGDGRRHAGRWACGHQRQALYRGRPDGRRDFRGEARHPARDRRLRPRARPPRGAGQRLARREPPGGVHPAPRWRARLRHPADGAAQRQRHRGGERPPRDPAARAAAGGSG